MNNIEDFLIQCRQQLHEYPELSNQEYGTTKAVKEYLESYDIKILNLPLETGLVAELQGDLDGPVIALRCDIDALPIQENSNVSFRSKNDGVMHACGHDVHTSVMLGAAILLKQQEQELKGTIRILFQPAEEIGEGALAILRTGVLNECKAIFGLHNDPTLPLGVIGTRHGALTAGVDRFNIQIVGRGSHAAKPHEANDPIVIAAHLVTAIQTIISRNVAATDQAVVSITQLHSGNTWNVIPESAAMEGTVRSFGREIRASIIERMEKIVQGIAETFQTQIDISWHPGIPSVDNDAQWTDFALDMAAQSGFETRTIQATSVGEDFSFYQEKLPGAFVMVGSGGPYELHDPKFQADDRMIMPAARYFALLAQHALDKLTSKPSDM